MSQVATVLQVSGEPSERSVIPFEDPDGAEKTAWDELLATSFKVAPMSGREKEAAHGSIIEAMRLFANRTGRACPPSRREMATDEWLPPHTSLPGLSPSRLCARHMLGPQGETGWQDC